MTTPIVYLSGSPTRADIDAAPVGIYDVIREDLRRFSTVQPVDRTYIERTDVGYRGVLYSKEQPYMFALNGNGFIAKPLEDSPAVIFYCSKLEDAERAATAQLDGRRADDEQDEFNDEFAIGSPTEGSLTAVVEDAPVETLVQQGPAIDFIERVPGTYQQMRQGAARLSADKELKGACGGGIVVNKDGKVLLVKPTNGYGGYDWTFPKGYPTSEEKHTAATCVREVREETGYGVNTKRFIGRFAHNDGGTCDYYECDLTNAKQLSDPDPNETEQVKWCSLIEALELLNDDVDVKILATANSLIPQLVIKGTHSGTMVALHLPKKIAKKLALKGGEPASSMHITLAYLGKGLSDSQKQAAASVVRTFAATAGPIRAKLGGVGRFSASETSDGKDVVYLSVDSPDLTKLRPLLVSKLEEAGLPPSQAHGFVPHVTLAYVDTKAKTPIDRFKPVELMFDNVSLTVADQQLPFPLQKLIVKGSWKHKLHGGRAEDKKPSDFDHKKLMDGAAHEHEHTDDDHIAEEIAMDHLDKDPDYYTKLSKIEKAARNVKNPGSRGGKFWIDTKNQVRYDERPSPADMSAGIADTTAKPAAGESIYVHKNAMGIRFLRHESDFAESDEKAGARYAPHGMNVSGQFVKGEVHYVFDALYNTRAKTMDDFIKKEIKPIWDDEGGAKPYSLENARAWMDKMLTVLEHDNAIAPGGKDLIEGRSDVNWSDLLDCIKKLPVADFVKHDQIAAGTPPFHEALERSQFPESMANQQGVRDHLRKILAHFGIKKEPAGHGKNANRLIVSSTYGPIADGSAAAFHKWDGEVWISKTTRDKFQRFVESQVRDEGKTTLADRDGIMIMVHEALHGYSDMDTEAYQGVGVLVEEVATEVAARYVVRERFGHLRDVSDPNVKTMTGPGLMSRMDERYLAPSDRGAYGDYINTVLVGICMALSRRDLQRPIWEWKPKAQHMLEQAALKMKQRTRKAKAKTPGQHLDRFVDCFDELSDSEKKDLTERIRQFTKGYKDLKLKRRRKGMFK